ncbi:hypothetical protein Ahy_A08g040401 [Arachis hypogaea]|uniref:Uncharacterized protein n=1 Tax=Arachis hypogaea TaxID=3818 RepID=A0A445BZT3_ARAHY|nr:hypothetical protein Ahy_A08g040401 [Arachis hypogaea]
MLQTDDSKTLRQYARCYILLLIGGYLMTDKSNNLVHLRWLPLLADFVRCRELSWESAVLAWTYYLMFFANRMLTDGLDCMNGRMILQMWLLSNCRWFLDMVGAKHLCDPPTLQIFLTK